MKHTPNSPHYNMMTLHESPLNDYLHVVYLAALMIIVCPIIGCSLLISIVQKGFAHLNLRFNSCEADTTVNPSKHRKEFAVFITGCDTGFGRDLAFALERKGFVVFPGCLTENGTKQYDEKNNMFPLRVDVTKSEDLERAARSVVDWLEDSSASTPRCLHAVVNNAGVGVGGLVDWIDLAAHQKVMDINYFGTIRTVKAFLPILKTQACGNNQTSSKIKHYQDARIINVVSMAGLVVNAGISSYYGSKHAQEAFTSVLRMELKPFNIPVVSVNPSVHETPMNDGLGKQISSIWNSLRSDLQEEYGVDYYKRYYNFICKDHIKVMWKAKNVEDKLVYCVETRNPPPQILVGSNAMYQSMIFRMLPVSLQVKVLKKVTPLNKANKMAVN